MSTPDADIVTKLAASSITGITAAGTDIFQGPEDSVMGRPSVCTFVTSYGGPPPTEIFGNGTTKPRIDTYSVQVLCRGLPHDPTSPKTRARACIVALHRASITGYLAQGCACVQTEPTYLGPDPSGQFRYSFNVQLKKEITT